MATGVIEICAAIGLLVRKTVRLTGILLILFFIVILPSNIYAAMNRVNLRNAGNDGPGSTSLLFRIPLQVLFILWTYWFAVRKAAPVTYPGHVGG
ncbi:MAG: hypothetical protein WKF97_07595 [Chitinophagaceae bacterium]